MSITMEEYQTAAARTGNEGAFPDTRLSVAGLGLAGEAGEVVDLIKKQIGHGHPADAAKIADELGDVLWYVAEVATVYGLDLADIAAANVAKLRRRYPEGFNHEASRNRAGAAGA